MGQDTETTFLFELLTPEDVVISQPVREVVIPGQEGYFGVQASHTYFATMLKSGLLTVKWGEQVRRYLIDGGVAQVTPEKVVVCAESAVLEQVQAL
ncbi:MAG: F0F1 ATP synthase subunit epsilon [candidate division WOR-3 bacterium]